MSFRLCRYVLIASAALCGASEAACVYKPFEFFPDKNDGVIVSAVVEKDTSCQHKFKEGRGYHFTSVEIDGAQPLNGEVKKLGDGEFFYTPKPGFVGDDVYVFKICATKDKAKGCSAVAIEAHVREARADAKSEAAASDCGSGTPPDRVIAACGRIIDDKSASAADQARALKWRGVAYFRGGDRARAITDFNKAIERDPKDSEAFNNRGLALQQQGDLDKALADFDKALALQPRMAATLVNRANAWRKKGDYPRAIADASRAIELSPGYAGAFKARGLALLGKKDFDGAIGDLTKALDTPPPDPEALVARGDAYMAKGDMEKAGTDYEQARKLVTK